MATLLGNKIKDTYAGLLKTTDNLAITGAVNVTDGAGNSAGITLNPGNSEFQIDGNGTNSPRATFNDSRIGNASVFVPLNLKDGIGTIRAQINFDQYSSFNVLAGQIGQYDDPELIVGNLGKSPGTAKIAVQQNGTAGSAYLSANNSDNWYTAYNERITSGSYAAGNLTLTKPNGTDIVIAIPDADTNTTYDLASAQNLTDVDVTLTGSDASVDTIKLVAGPNVTLTDDGSNNITIESANTDTNTTYNLDSIQAGTDVALTLVGSDASLDTVTLVAGTNITLTDDGSNNVTIDAAGGGGAAGLVNGIGTSSLKNADALVAQPAAATRNLAIGLGDNARSYAQGGLAIGAGALSGNQTQTRYSSIAIGQNSQATENGSLGLGPAALSNASNATSIGEASRANTGANNATVIGQTARVSSPNATIVGYGCQLQTATGSGAVIIGQGINANSTTAFANTTVIGTSAGYTGDHVECVYIGGGQSYTGSSFSTSTLVGFGNQFTGNADNSAAVGASNTIQGSNAFAIGVSNIVAANCAAIGQNITANRINHVSVEQLETKTIGGGIVMYSPDGTAYRLTIANGGTVSVAAA